MKRSDENIHHARKGVHSSPILTYFSLYVKLYSKHFIFQKKVMRSFCRSFICSS